MLKRIIYISGIKVEQEEVEKDTVKYFPYSSNI